MGYTLGQLRGYAAGAVAVQNERLAALVNVIAVGSRGDAKAMAKMVKALNG